MTAPNVTMEEITRLVGLQLAKRKVQPTDRLFEDLGAESLDLASLIAAVEDKYGIVVGESTISRVRTPTDLYELVKRQLQSRQ